MSITLNKEKYDRKNRNTFYRVFRNPALEESGGERYIKYQTSVR
jgi:hypothetical protein